MLSALSTNLQNARVLPHERFRLIATLEEQAKKLEGGVKVLKGEQEVLRQQVGGPRWVPLPAPPPSHIPSVPPQNPPREGGLGSIGTSKILSRLWFHYGAQFPSHVKAACAFRDFFVMTAPALATLNPNPSWGYSLTGGLGASYS